VARYRILIKSSAAKEIEGLPTMADRKRVLARIQGLADDPRPRGAEKLSGRGKYRLRQGVYRIIYSVSDTVLIVHVVKVGHRGDAYRH
jgi:mRNA interferase RelE/StbE